MACGFGRGTLSVDYLDIIGFQIEVDSHHEAIHWAPVSYYRERVDTIKETVVRKLTYRKQNQTKRVNHSVMYCYIAPTTYGTGKSICPSPAGCLMQMQGIYWVAGMVSRHIPSGKAAVRASLLEEVINYLTQQPNDAGHVIKDKLKEA